MKGINCLYKDRDGPTKSTRKRLDNHRGTPDLTLNRLCFEKPQEMPGKKWVLLVAGSKGWEHYQHQANVCCFYQIIKKHGIPDEQIVVMMYDDIAHNKVNPTDGEIVSVLPEIKDVYSGVPKDYTGEEVTPENFLAALQGESTGKKVIKSDAGDNIYVYMTGLGKEGTFEFPEKSLHTDELIGAIKNMSQQSKFHKMVMFMTSSYAASMFENLSDQINVYALTACEKYTQSSPSDYDDTRKIFLSDKFSSVWLKFIDKADFNTATFEKLVLMKQATYLHRSTGPCTCQFGTLEIRKSHLCEFLAAEPPLS